MKRPNLIEKLARPAILKLQPYSSARGEFSGQANIFLDANENALGSAIDLPYVEGDLNRYPDPLQKKLRSKVAEIKELSADQIFVGNGSDEAIDLLLRVFCEPKKDAILITPPTYGMYEVIANIQSVAVHKVFLDSEFQLDTTALKKKLNTKTKIVFVCSPNNPTGNDLRIDTIRKLAEIVPGLLVVDEAYIDFSDQPSAITLLKKYPNIVVLQTLSKAWGLAGIRVGFAFGNPKLIALLQKIKFPYNLSSLAQNAALEALESNRFLNSSVALLRSERARVSELLVSSPEVTRVFPSSANFVLVKFKKTKKVFESLKKRGIITRDRSETRGCEDCIRITIGSVEENNILLESLGVSLPESNNAGNSKIFVKRRKTKETDIKIKFSLSGEIGKIDTKIGFLDHMITLLAAHAGISLSLCARGDTHVDFHHTVEDCALALGETLRLALGEVRGLTRYGFYLPMDEASTQVALDISGRALLLWNVPLQELQVGSVSSTLFEHFFKSFCDAAKITLHIKASGKDDHHVIESVFKAVGRSLRSALKQDGSDSIPSTKGIL